jgi:hypothetical protein
MQLKVMFLRSVKGIIELTGAINGFFLLLSVASFGEVFNQVQPQNSKT